MPLSSITGLSRHLHMELDGACSACLSFGESRDLSLGADSGSGIKQIKCQVEQVNTAEEWRSFLFAEMTRTIIITIVSVTFYQDNNSKTFRASVLVSQFTFFLLFFPFF